MQAPSRFEGGKYDGDSRVWTCNPPRTAPFLCHRLGTRSSRVVKHEPKSLHLAEINKACYTQPTRSRESKTLQREETVRTERHVLIETLSGRGQHRQQGQAERAVPRRLPLRLKIAGRQDASRKKQKKKKNRRGMRRNASRLPDKLDGPAIRISVQENAASPSQGSSSRRSARRTKLASHAAGAATTAETAGRH